MRHLHSFALPFAFSLFLAAPLADAPRFAVKAKTKVSKIFESGSKVSLKKVSMQVDDKEFPISEVPEDALVLDDKDRYEITDEYLGVSKGRPTKVKRTFDKLSSTSERRKKGGEGDEDDESGDSKTEKKSELEGKSVLFTWNEKDESYDKAYDGEGEKKLLEDLKEDMDFRGFLPDGAVSEAKSWDVEVKVFDEMLSPGGDLALKAEEKDAVDDDTGKQLHENVHGKAHATWKGTREVDGKKVGVILLNAEFDTFGTSQKSEDGQEYSLRLGIKLELEGELLWDLDAGHFQSVDVHGPMKVSMENSSTGDFGGESHKMKQVMEFEGEATFGAHIAP